MLYLLTAVGLTPGDSLIVKDGLQNLGTPWSSVLEKLNGSQLVKKFPTFYGTRSFITAFTKVPATCPYPGPYPEPDQYSPHLHILLPEDPS
jgi:hypothetical protein